MKFLSLIFILLMIASVVSAQTDQNETNKSKGMILLNGHDAFGDNKFYINIYLQKNSAKIVCAYRDSIRYADVRNDVTYNQIRLERQKHEVDDLKQSWLIDSIARIFEKHSAYSRDSITIDLKKDKEYRDLLGRFSHANKEELAPKIERTWLDGYTVSTCIITKDKNLKVHTDTPGSNTHPLLIKMIASSLSKRKDSDAVKKILMFYQEFK